MHRQQILLLLIIAGLVASLFINLNVVELRAEEPRRATVAMEMYLKQDYIAPHLNGWHYYNKPPLFNWLLIGLFMLFGSFDEWVVRIPTIIAFLLMGLVTYQIVKRYLNRDIAILSSLFFLTSGDLLFYGTATGGEIDVFYSLLVLVQVLAIFHFYQKGKYLWMFVLSYFFMSLGVLTKGVPSILFQVLTLLPFLWQQKNLRLLFSWKHVAGIGLFLVIVGGYFYAYSLRGNVEFFAINLLKEASKKSALETNVMDTLKKTFFFPLDLVKYLLPWSLLVVFFFNKLLSKQIRQNSLTAFCLLFILFNILVYWITGESRSRYIYMFFPFICSILAYAYYQTKDSGTMLVKVIKTIFTIIVILLCVAFAAVPFVPKIAGVSHVVVAAVGLTLAMLVIAYCYGKWKDSRLYLVILSLVIARIGLALIYFPVYQATSTSGIYRQHAANMIKITGSAPIYYYGVRREFATGLSLGSLVISEVNIVTPPELPYQLPYYLTKSNKQVMAFTEKMEKAQYYLAYLDNVDLQQVNVLYRFKEKYMNKEMVLIQLK